MDYCELMNADDFGLDDETVDWTIKKPGLLSRVINGPMQRRLEKSFEMTDHFLMAAGHTRDERWFSKAVANLPEGITEIGIHPGWSEEWRRIDCEDCFACDLSGVELMSFNEIG